jgi:hypothetical protein
LDETESWEDLGEDLAYLFSAMSRGAWVDATEETPIVVFLRAHPGDGADIALRYIKIEVE